MRRLFACSIICLLVAWFALRKAETGLQQRLLQRWSAEGQWLPAASGHTLFIRYKPAPLGPVFLLEGGLGSTSWSLEALAMALSPYGSVISYDRQGLGMSRGSGADPDLLLAAEDTREVLARFAGDRPVVLVAHSLGSAYALNFYRRFPHRLAALVLLDPPHPRELELPKSYLQQWLGRKRLANYRTALAAELGLPRLWFLAKAAVRDGSPSHDEQLWSRMHTRTTFNETTQFFAGIVGATDFYTPVGSFPLLVLSSTLPLAPEHDFRHLLQADLAQLSSRGQQRLLADGDHWVFVRPASVGRAVGPIVDYLRSFGLLAEANRQVPAAAALLHKSGFPKFCAAAVR